MAKITKEELQEIKEQQNSLQAILNDIGVIEVRKHEALHAQAVIYQEVEKTKKKLEEQYGSINIDMTDGSYTEIEQEDETELTVVKSND
tara:strand:+ start:222 stop:488 length:267 start_codon:yes stop_codon:yes gene_type:complete